MEVKSIREETPAGFFAYAREKNSLPDSLLMLANRSRETGQPISISCGSEKAFVRKLLPVSLLMLARRSLGWVPCLVPHVHRGNEINNQF